MSEQLKPSIWPRLFLYLMLVDLVVIAIGICGRMLLDWQPLTSFHLYFYGAQLGLVLALLGLLQMLFGIFKKQKPHTNFGALSLALGLLPLLLALISVGVSEFKAPMIHDISTDLSNPPVFSITNSLRTADENSLEHAGESIAIEQSKAFPDIQTFFSELTQGAARKKTLQAIDELGWVLIVNDESTGSIEAYDKTRVFGFIDDVVIRISPVENGTQIDVRSVSRVGLGDLGANAERIRLFLKVFASGQSTAQ